MIDPNLQKLKDNFIANLKELLENKAKKTAKKLQTEAEDLFNTFNDSVAQYQRKRVKELEEKVAQKEDQTLKDLDNQLNQI